MPVPTPNSPIPPEVRPIVERVHRRLLAYLTTGSDDLRNVPLAIDDPRNVPLTAQERYDLAKFNYYPIPPDVLRFGMTPAEHQRQEFLDTVAAQLPAAVVAIQEAAKS
jgi:hypothetical protein